jgi:hypothetical protein
MPDLAAVDDDAFRTSMPLKSLGQKRFAAARSRCPLSQNPTVSPMLSIAR